MEQEECIAQAEQCAAAGDSATAVAIYRSYLEENPEDAVVYQHLGAELHALEEYMQAFQASKRAVELDQDNYKAWFNCGLSLDLLSRTDEAITYFSKAIAIKNDYTKAFYARGNCYSEAKKYGEAVADYTASLMLDEDLFPAARFQRALAFEELAMPLPAALDFAMFVRRHPEDTSALCRLANILLLLGRYDEAELYVAQCQEVEPDNELARILSEAIQKIRN